MGRLTPFGTLVVFLLLVAVVVGGMALTNNLRWPPFGLTLSAGAATVTPAALPAANSSPAPATAVAAATDPPVAGNVPVSDVQFTATTQPTVAPTNTPTNTPQPTNTPTSTPTNTPTPTPTPLGLVY